MKTIREKTKKAILFAISTVAALSLGAGVGSITASANTTSLTMNTEGAGVRIKGDWGIRFQTNLSPTDYAKLNESYETGVIAIPTDLLDSAEELVVGGTNVAQGVTYGGEENANEWEKYTTEAGEEKYEAYAYFTAEEMGELNYTRNISFRGYWKYADGNYEYTDVVNRSMTYVANKALKDDETKTADDVNNKDLVLNDEQETKAKEYVTGYNYTVKYVNGVTGAEIDETTVEVGATTVTDPENMDTTLFGGEFKNWTTLGEEWNDNAKNAITGDTVVKSTYTASETLDFTQATEVPTHLIYTKKSGTGTANPTLTINEEEDALYNLSWRSDTYTISFLEEMTLSQYDKIVIDMKVVIQNTAAQWYQVMPNPTGNPWWETGEQYIISEACQNGVVNEEEVKFSDNTQAAEYNTYVYEVGADGLTFKTLGFAGAYANAAYRYYIKSIKIERFDWENLNFEGCSTKPAYWYVNGNGYTLNIEEDVIGTADDGSEIKAKAMKVGNLANGGYIQITYPSMQLNVGDKIVVKLSFVGNSASGLEVNVNNTWNGEGNASATTGKDTNGYVDCTINIENACTLNTLQIRPWGTTTTLNVVSVIIERA